jgi:hypothetical protein
VTETLNSSPCDTTGNQGTVTDQKSLRATPVRTFSKRWAYMLPGACGSARTWRDMVRRSACRLDHLRMKRHSTISMKMPKRIQLMSFIVGASRVAAAAVQGDCGDAFCDMNDVTSACAPRLLHERGVTAVGFATNASRPGVVLSD